MHLRNTIQPEMKIRRRVCSFSSGRTKKNGPEQSLGTTTTDAEYFEMKTDDCERWKRGWDRERKKERECENKTTEIEREKMEPWMSCYHIVTRQWYHLPGPRRHVAYHVRGIYLHGIFCSIITRVSGYAWHVLSLYTTQTYTQRNILYVYLENTEHIDRMMVKPNGSFREQVPYPVAPPQGQTIFTRKPYYHLVSNS